MCKHHLTPIPCLHTKKTLYWVCIKCDQDVRIARGVFRKMFVRQENPRRRIRTFRKKLKSDGSLKFNEGYRSV